MQEVFFKYVYFLTYPKDGIDIVHLNTHFPPYKPILLKWDNEIFKRWKMADCTLCLVPFFCSNQNILSCNPRKEKFVPNRRHVIFEMTHSYDSFSLSLAIENTHHGNLGIFLVQVQPPPCFSPSFQLGGDKQKNLRGGYFRVLRNRLYLSEKGQTYSFYSDS